MSFESSDQRPEVLETLHKVECGVSRSRWTRGWGLLSAVFVLAALACSDRQADPDKVVRDYGEACTMHCAQQFKCDPDVTDHYATEAECLAQCNDPDSSLWKPNCEDAAEDLLICVAELPTCDAYMAHSEDILSSPCYEPTYIYSVCLATGSVP